MLLKTMNGILIYIGFVWGITWRTFAAAVAAAILVGIGLGFLSVHLSWPPEHLDYLSSLSGVPITVLVLTFVAWDRGLALRDRLTTTPI